MPAAGATEASLVSLMLGSGTATVRSARETDAPGVGEASVALPPPTNGHAPSLKSLARMCPTQLGGCNLRNITLSIHPRESWCGGGSRQWSDGAG